MAETPNAAEKAKADAKADAAAGISDAAAEGAAEGAAEAESSKSESTGESAASRARSFHVPSPGTSTLIAGVAVAVITYDDVKTRKNPFMNLFYGGLLIVVLALVAQASPALANAIATLFLLTALYSLFNKKG